MEHNRNRNNLFRLLAATFALWIAVVEANTAPFLLPDSGRPSIGDDLFTNAGIRHISIEISDEGLAVLRRYRYRRGANAQTREAVPATVREGDTVYTNVAIHLKGALGSFRPIDSSKPAFTLNFDKFADGQRFHGLQKISLNNSVQDPSCMNEKISRELFTRAGVPVPRADYATIELNGRYLGLYVLTEGWHRQFLGRFYRNTRGNLYDASAVGRDVNARMLVVSGEDDDADQSALRSLAQAAAEMDPNRRVALISERIDLERFMTLAALDVLLWNWDGYSMNRNNYRIFHDRSSGRLVFFPHGMDQMFWYPEGPLVTGTKGIVSRALLKTSEGRRLYVQRAADLRADVLHEDAMLDRVDELAARLRPAVRKSGFGALFQFENAVRDLKGRISERIRQVDEQLLGVRNLLHLGDGDSVPLNEWRSQVERGKIVCRETDSPRAYEIRAEGIGSGSWHCTVWLEEGQYRVSARVKTQDLVCDPKDQRAGAGLRVLSQRKRTDGVHWDWFPYRQSSDPRARAELPPLDASSPRLIANRDWTEIHHLFELRQPIADLEIHCDLRAQKGAATFDPGSLRLTRIGAAVP